MSKAAEVSSIRRLAGLFTKTSLSSTTESTVGAAANSTKPSSENNISALVTGKPSSKSTLIAASNKPSSKSDKIAHKLQRLVRRFKKFCESDKFRNHDYRTYAYTVRLLAASRKFSLIDDILQHQKKYQEISQEPFVNRLMILYGIAGMLGRAKNLFDEMPELNCDRTVRSFNALLSACIYSKKFDEVEKLYKALPEKLGIEPDLISYNTVIKALCEMRSFHSALSLVETMEKKGIEPDIITFNTLLDGFYRKGQIAAAEKIWGSMKKRNVVPDIWSYNSKLRGLVYENKTSEAVKLLEEMGSKGIKPDVHSYNALIQGYCNDGNLEQVKKLYGELKENGISPDRVTYYRLVYFLCTRDELEMAAKLCKEVIDRWGYSGVTLLQSKVIDELIKHSRIEEAVQLVELGKLQFHYNLTLPKCE